MDPHQFSPIFPTAAKNATAVHSEKQDHLRRLLPDNFDVMYARKSALLMMAADKDIIIQSIIDPAIQVLKTNHKCLDRTLFTNGELKEIDAEFIQRIRDLTCLMEGTTPNETT